MAKKKQSFEQSIARLEEIVALMEDPACGIESLVGYYKEAAELSKFLNETLTGFEQTVTLLTKTPEGFAETPFDADV